MQQRLIRHKVGAGMLALAGAVTPVAAQGAPAPESAEAAEAASARGAPSARDVRTATSGRPARPIIVLESYVGQRPDDAGAIMRPLLDELDARGFVARPRSILERVGGRAPRPGALDPDRTAAEITQPADTGFAAYTRGRFVEAEAVLTLAIDQIHRNPALLVLDTNNLHATFQVLVALALSQAKRGDTGGSVATMVELIRTFRSQPITRTDYGPDAEQFYRAVWKQVQAMGRGQLSITVENDQAVIFVDGQIHGLGKAALADLIPGVYRVFVQVPGTAGRQYELEVNANELAELHVDWELDASLWMTDSWIGFVFATEAERAKQAVFAGKLARRWGQLIAVVALVQQHGKAGVTVSLYDTAGNAVRSAMVALPGALDGIDERKLRSLARFLADGTPGDGVSVVRDRPARTARSAAAGGSGGSGRSRLVPSLLLGVGVAAFVAGGVLYVIDQDPSPGAPSVYRDTAPAGLAVGAAGLAAAGMGLWLWGTRSGRSSAPILAIGCCGGFVGWAGEL